MKINQFKASSFAILAAALYAISSPVSKLLLKEIPSFSFVIALAIMLIGTYLASSEEHSHRHSHLVITHEHSHNHDDGHHSHAH